MPQTVENVDTRCVTHPVFPHLWLVQCRLYGDTWSTLAEGNVVECARHEAWMAGLTPAKD